jgi:hypothetical protein
MDFIPLDVVPLIGVSTSTIETIKNIPSVIPVKVPDASEKMVKSMEDMPLQGKEIRKLQEEVKILQDLKSIFQSIYHA